MVAPVNWYNYPTQKGSSAKAGNCDLWNMETVLKRAFESTKDNLAKI